MRTIEYAGRVLEVPDWARYVTQDFDMEISFWENEPVFYEGGQFWVSSYKDDGRTEVAQDAQLNPAAGSSLKRIL